MKTSILTSKNRISLPGEIVRAARLRFNDEISWSVDPSGELHGRKLSTQPVAAGKLMTDRKTGLLFWAGIITDVATEEAALKANDSRHE